MGKSRGSKFASSRAGHKSKNKKTYRGRFSPLMSKEDIEKYIDNKTKKDNTEWKESPKDLFNSKKK